VPASPSARSRPNRGIEVSGTITAEGDLDFRGTLGDRGTPVGLSEIRLLFDLDSSAPSDDLDELVVTTERYCVIYQTLAAPPRLEDRCS
jgi:hypothetical protein